MTLATGKVTEEWIQDDDFSYVAVPSPSPRQPRYLGPLGRWMNLPLCKPAPAAMPVLRRALSTF